MLAKQQSETAAALPGSNPGNVAEVIRETVSALKDSQADPIKDSLFNKLLEKALNPPAAPPPGGEMKEVLLLMVAQEKEARHRLEEEMKELRKTIAEARNPAGQLESELAQQVRIKNLVRQLAGKPDAPTEPESEWITVAKTALEKLPEAISMFQLGRPRPQQQAQQRAQQTQPAAVAAAGDAQPATDAQPPEGANDLQTKYIQALSKHQGLLMKIAPFMNDYFVNELGAPEITPGTAFRDWFMPRYGIDNWRAIKADLPAEAITEIIGATPQLAETLKPPAKVLQFLKDFYTEPEPDTPDDTPVDGVQAPKANGVN